MCHAGSGRRRGAARSHALARRSGSSDRWRRIQVGHVEVEHVEQVEQVDRVGLPTDRGREEWCRVQPSRWYALAYLADTGHGSGSTRPTCAKRQVGRSAFHRWMEQRIESPLLRRKREPLFDNRWSGKKAVHAVHAVQPHRHDRGSPSAGEAWCSSGGLTRLPLLGAPSASSRRRRCHADRSTNQLTVSRGHSSSGRASGCRPEGCELETRWPRSRAPVPPSPSGAHAVLHTPRAGGAAGRGAPSARRMDRVLSTSPGATTGCAARMEEPRRA